MTEDKRTESSSSDSCTTQATDDVVEEEARKLFDSQHVIPPHQIPNVLQWLQESFSLVELQVLKASLEKNAVYFDDKNSCMKLQGSNYNDKGQQLIEMLSETIQKKQAMNKVESNMQNISDTKTSQKYSEIPYDKETSVDQMEWNIIKYKALSVYTKTQPGRDTSETIYCLQQECQPWREKLNNVLIMLQHSMQYITTVDDNEAHMLRPFMTDCESKYIRAPELVSYCFHFNLGQTVVYLRKLRSTSGRLMLPILAQHFSLRYINLALQCCYSSNKQRRKNCLAKIPRMHTTPSKHNYYHLKQRNSQSHRSHEDARELIIDIAAIKIQTSWRATMTRNNMLFAISLEQLFVYIAVIFQQGSSTSFKSGNENLCSSYSFEEKLDLMGLAKIREKTFKKYYYANLHHCLEDLVGAVREAFVQNPPPHNS